MALHPRITTLTDALSTMPRRLPVTTGIVLIGLLASAIALPLGGREAVGYGLPSALAGQWWTFVVGAFVTPTALLAPVLLALVGTAIGTLESRIGSARTGVVVVLTHLAGSLGAAGVLLAGQALPWPWAHGLAHLVDVGPSAAGVGALAVLASTWRPAVRGPVVAGVGAYLTVMLVLSGLLWDLEHLIAFGAGLVIAPSVTGARRLPRVAGTALSRVRTTAALLVAAAGVAGAVQVYFPGYGGALGSGTGTSSGISSLPLAVGLLVAALVLGDGLRRGARWAWRIAPLGSTLALFAGLVGAGWSAGTLTCLVLVVGLGVVHRRLTRTARPCPARVDVRDRLRRHGGGTLGWQHTWPGSTSWTSADGQVSIGYRACAGVAIVVADPVGPRFRWFAATQEFAEHCRTERLVPAWYAVSETFLRETGREHRAVRIGEDAVIDLGSLEMRGKPWQDVRTARNRAAREGIVMRRVDLADTATPAVARIAGQVRAISSAWVADKPLPEMGFTLGGVREALDPEVRVHVALDAEGIVHGVLSWLPVHRDDAVVGWTLDLMRRADTGFRPAMEFLIAESLLAFRDEGFETASLSVAPLARSGAPDGAVERLLAASGALLEPVYGFGSLLAFKRKFSPDLRPVHLAYESALDLPRIGVAIGHAYLPGLSPRQLLTLGRVLLAAQSCSRQASSSSSATTPGSASGSDTSTADSRLPHHFSEAQGHSATAATMSPSASITRSVVASGSVAKMVRRENAGKP